MVGPCKDCPDRHLACHDHCEKYQAYKAKNNKRLEEQHIQGAIDGARAENTRYTKYVTQGRKKR